MISPREADTIKQILGYKYADKILEFLAEKKVVRPSGEAYQSQDVYQVMNSNRENKEMEKSIFDLVAITKENTEKEAQRRKALLQT